MSDADVVAVCINESATEHERAIFGAMLLVAAIRSEQLAPIELIDLLLDIRRALVEHAPDELGVLR